MSDITKQFRDGMTTFAIGVRQGNIATQDSGLKRATDALASVTASLSESDYNELVAGLAEGVAEFVAPLEKRVAAIEAKLDTTGGANGR